MSTKDGAQIVADGKELKVEELYKSKLHFAEWRKWTLALANEKGHMLSIEKALYILETYPNSATAIRFYGDFNWQLHPTQLKRLKKIIINSKKIEKIWFDAPITAMQTVRKALEKNTSVTTLSFSFTFPTIEPLNFTKEITKMIKNNPRIKRITAAYEQKSEKFLTTIMAAASCNPSIDSFGISEKTSLFEGIYLGNRLDLIRDSLAKNPNITEFILGKCYVFEETLLGEITDIIKQNKLKIFGFNGTLRTHYPNVVDLTKFISTIRLSSLTTLNLVCDHFQAEFIADIISIPNIKTLSINMVGDANLVAKALANNTTLETLNLACKDAHWVDRESNREFFGAWNQHPTLKSFSLARTIMDVDLETISNLLGGKPSLTSLDLPQLEIGSHFEKRKHAALICEKLRANQKIKKLRISLEGDKKHQNALFQVVSQHSSLTSFDIGFSKDLLRKTVIDLDSKNLFRLPNHEIGDVLALLVRNREYRMNIILATKIIQKSFWTSLPAELWVKIIDYLTYGLSIDYLKLLNIEK